MVGVAGLVGAAVLALRHRDEVKRELASLRTSPISEVRSNGLARIGGHVRPAHETLVAPVSGRPCLAFELWVRRAVRGSGTIEVGHLSDARSFWVEDGTGQALVDPNRRFAVSLGEALCVSTDDLPAEARERLERFLYRHGLSLVDPGGGTHLVSEGLVIEGARVSVAGFATVEVHPAGDAPPLRGSPVLRALRGSRRCPIVVSDDPALIEAGRAPDHRDAR